jgi:signal transduction histidine kinase
LIGAAIAVGGWVVATGAAIFAVMAWRLLATRMECVARACHELRGPLAAARLGIELGARTGELSAPRLRAIDQELGRAALALEDLAHARRRRPDGRREQVDVAQLLADSVEAWRCSALARHVRLDLQWSGARAYVEGDRLRIAQATGNLIANAIEHGGGTVVVRGWADEGAVRIEVSDGGPGLPAPVAELVRRAHGGHGRRGRGLAIATAVAESHGGRLAAAPAECGARLVLQLPAAGAPRASTHAGG